MQETRAALGVELRGSIVIIDEAHNLVGALNSAHSASINLQQLCRLHMLSSLPIMGVSRPSSRQACLLIHSESSCAHPTSQASCLICYTYHRSRNPAMQVIEVQTNFQKDYSRIPLIGTSLFGKSMRAGHIFGDQGVPSNGSLL